ncbi:hypothetical protein D3C87_1631220 [compost metagenome]
MFERGIDDIGDLAHGMAENLGPLHMHMARRAGGRGAAVDIEFVPMAPVGAQGRCQDAARRLIRRLVNPFHDNGTGTVAKQDTGGAVVPIEQAREGFSADDQHAAGHAVFDVTVRGGNRIDEAGANRLDIEGETVMHAQLHLHQRGGAGEGVVRRGGGHHDHVDIFDGEPGMSESSA